MSAALLEMREITKLFAKVIANDRVSLSVGRGEVLALLGENGAGKSTVMKILYGLYRADSGRILVDGREARIESPKDAMSLGIAMIQQHFSLVGPHSVVENVILGRFHGIVDARACEEKLRSLASMYGFDLDPQAPVRDLPVGAQQKVEILKALYREARLLVMDEPTAVLTPRESESLMDFVRSYVGAGNSVVFITHKLKEVMEVADRIVVMRGGRVHGERRRSETDERELASLMIGRELPPHRPSAPVQEGARTVLSLENATARDRRGVERLRSVNLSIREGEILGIAGVSGNGQDELCEVVCGARPLAAGAVRLEGRDLAGVGIRERIELGIGYVPADRHRDGLVMDMSIAENMILKSSFGASWRRGPFLDRRRMARSAREAIESYSIKAPGPDALAKGLSGGNQQKLVVAREVGTSRALIIFNQPTRGLDLGAIDYVHSMILAEKGKGKAVLLVSTELSEIFALSDRIAVMFKGAIMGIFPRGELAMERVGLLMAGYSEAGA
jgi:simple sugar transport system ATP-binding protein